jgi:hypothetical protein
MQKLTFAQAVRWVEWNRVALIALRRRDGRAVVGALHDLRRRVKNDRRRRTQPGAGQPVTLEEVRAFAWRVSRLRDQLQTGGDEYGDPPDFAAMAQVQDETFFEPDDPA